MHVVDERAYVHRVIDLEDELAFGLSSLQRGAVGGRPLFGAEGGIYCEQNRDNFVAPCVEDLLAPLLHHILLEQHVGRGGALLPQLLAQLLQACHKGVGPGSPPRTPS